MPKTQTVSTETKENEQEEVVEKRAAKKVVQTDWDVLRDAGFVPVRIRCDGYKGEHPSDLSCHTNLIPTGENMLRHANPDHGGGWFRVRFKLTDVEEKKSKVWTTLKDAGYVISDFWCPHCRKDVGVVPREIIFHLQPHAGANRVNLDPQVLCMTIAPFGGHPVPEGSDLNNDLRMF